MRPSRKVITICERAALSAARPAASGVVDETMWSVPVVFLLLCLQAADFSDPSAAVGAGAGVGAGACVIDVECAECVPDNMPLVTSHRAANGSVRVAAGEQVTLACANTRFQLYPQASTLTARCEGGRFRVVHDRALRHLLDLGCQGNVFEDVLHEVEQCGPPLQGRAYQSAEAPAGSRGGVLHLATVCFDEDRALGVRARTCNADRNRVRVRPHAERTAPLTILGNFNQMFDAKTRHDAEILYSDEVRLNTRLRELLKHDRYNFAEQRLTAGKLLSGRYFDDQYVRVTEFPSNKVASWRSIVRGNLDHLHRDVADFMRRSRGALQVDVYAGTHGVLALAGAAVYLRAGNRFPVPKYLWTVVHAESENRALALVLLNDPYVRVSEIREAVFCESACGSVTWLHNLKRHRNYERPVGGLVFCCTLPEFTRRVTEMPNIFNATVKPLF